MTRKSFSERYGHKLPKQIQFEGMDDDLRTSLWNAFYRMSCPKDQMYVSVDECSVGSLMIRLWIHFLKRPEDDIPSPVANTLRTFKSWLFKAEWNEVFDFVEFVYENAATTVRKKVFKIACNNVLEREVSGYRFIGDIIAPMTNEMEIKEIEQAADKSPLTGVRKHITSALSLFADRKAPDYRNSIKESFSAVEAVRKAIAGKKGTSGKIRQVIKERLSLHPALDEGFSKMYDYASDADGIRHALMGASNLSSEDARYFLVSCSAFVNYLTEKAQKAGVKF